jgi:hypothetical protein
MLPSHIVPSPDDSFCQHKTTDDFIIGGHIEVYLARLTIRTRCVLENEVHMRGMVGGARGRIILVLKQGKPPAPTMPHGGPP